MHWQIAIRIKLVDFRVRISWTVLHNGVILYVFVKCRLNLNGLNAIHCIQNTLLSDSGRCLSCLLLQALRGEVTIPYLLLPLTGLSGAAYLTFTAGLLTVCDLALAKGHCFFVLHETALDIAVERLLLLNVVL